MSYSWLLRVLLHWFNGSSNQCAFDGGLLVHMYILVSDSGLSVALQVAKSRVIYHGRNLLERMANPVNFASRTTLPIFDP